MRVLLILGLAALAVCPPAWADSWKHGRGHGWHGGGGWVEAYGGPPWAVGYVAPPVIVVQQWAPATLDLPPAPQGPRYGETYRNDEGRYCREYQTTATIDGKRQQLYGTACLEPDGSWSFNN